MQEAEKYLKCYGAECWALKRDVRNLQTTEMKMQHIICGKTPRNLRDAISNETIYEMASMKKTDEFLKE